MIRRLAVVSAMAPDQARMTFAQYSVKRNGSPPKLLAGHWPLAWSSVLSGSAGHPTPVGSPLLVCTVTEEEPVALPVFEPLGIEAVTVEVPAATPVTRPVAFTVAK